MTKLFLIFSFAVALSGCGPTAPADTHDQTVKSYRVGITVVYEFRLDDGTRCVALYDNAVSCEWKNGR